MGVDLMCVGGCSFNWGAWQTLYDLGVAFGWKPAGTLVPIVEEGPPPTDSKLTGTSSRYSFWDGADPADPAATDRIRFSYVYPDENDETTPRGGYFNNDYYWVTETDATMWCAALSRALDALEGRTHMTAEQAEVVNEIRSGEAEDRTPLKGVAEKIAAAISNSSAFEKVFDFEKEPEDDPPPPSPEVLKAREEFMAEINASPVPKELEWLIHKFINKVAPRRGFAIA